MKRPHLATKHLVCCLAALSPILAGADVLIDSFDRAGSPAPWTFYNGAEFPGASGSLTAGTGYSGKGAHLAYDLSKGGHYVSANLTLSPTQPITTLGFWVKSPTNITVALRVVDATGQTLQYNLSRPLTDLDPSAWYYQSVPLNSANNWWGGSADGQLHGAVGSISILAADPFLAGAVGAIDFDNVTGFSSSTLDLDPAAQALVPGTAGSGDMLSRLGVNIHFTSDNQALDVARSAGLTWVRMDLIWSAVETSRGVYNWSAYDGLLNALQTRGMRALLILDYGNALYTGANNLPPTNTAAIQAFGNFAYAAARHFAGHGVRFEIWNEPNISGFWPPAPDATQYTAMAIAGVSGLRQGDPAAPIVTGGLAGFDFTFLNGFLALGGALGADAIGVHPYDCNPPERLSDRLMFLRAIAARYTTNTNPVWDTEWGFSSSWFGDGHSAAARQRQAVLVSRELLCANAVGFPLIIYYDLRDDGTDPTNAEHNFGLLANDYTDKPAMKAVRTLATVARNRRFSGFLRTGPSSLTAMRFDGRTNMVVAIWLAAPRAQATITVPTNTTAVDFLGTSLVLSNAGNRLSWTLSETNGPMFISFPYTWQSTNLAPMLAPIPDQTVIAGATLLVTNAATHADAPPQKVTYSLLSAANAPAGAAIDPSSGLFAWRPTMGQSETTNLIGVVATDNGVPTMSATQTFTATVLKPARPVLAGFGLTNGRFHATVSGDPGPDYSVLTSPNLVIWDKVLDFTSPTIPLFFSIPANTNLPRIFYRVMLGP